MKNRQKGFGLVETIFALGIAAIIALGTTTLAQQTMQVNAQTRSGIITTTQVENAGFWISRDAQMAGVVITENLTAPRFLEFSWTELILNGDSIYHSVIYTFTNVSGGTGDLTRLHWSSGGVNETRLVAKHIYYDPGDPANTSAADYLSPALTVRIVARFGQDTEIREFTVSRRPSFSW